MQTRHHVSAAAVLGGVLLLSLPHRTPDAGAGPATGPAAPVHDAASGTSAGAMARVPAAFVPNLGQWSHDARFTARLGGTTAFLDDGGLLLTVQGDGRGADGASGCAVRFGFHGAEDAEPRGEQPLAGTHSYFLGDDPARWRTDVPRFGRVRWTAAWPGIDVVAYEKDRHLEYDVELAPGADLDEVEIAVEGAERLTLAADGALVIETAAGPLRQPRPRSWVVDGRGAKTPIGVDYELRGGDRFGLRCSAWDGESALVVDPGLVWSTYLGADKRDVIWDADVGPSGVITVAGRTFSARFPATAGAFQTSLRGTDDAVVARLDPSRPAKQQLLAATFFGGSSADSGNSVSDDGLITFFGSSKSTDFPLKNAYDSTHNGDWDTVVVVLGPSLQQLLYSTYVGGSGIDAGWHVAVDPKTLVVTTAGYTESANYPTTNGAYDPSFNGTRDVYVTRLDWNKPPANQLVYSTFVGGSSGTWPVSDASAMVLDRSGRVWFCGRTRARDYPRTPNAFQPNHGGAGADAFLTCVDPAKTGKDGLHYSTYIGGSKIEHGGGLHVDARGVVTFSGWAQSPDFPITPNAFQKKALMPQNGFVLRLDPSRKPPAQQLLYSTFFSGTSGRAVGLGDVSVDAAGVITFVGSAFRTSTIPTTFGAYDRTGGQGHDGFLARLDPNRPPKEQLLYGTYLGGPGWEWGFPLAGIKGTVATVALVTNSKNLQTPPNAYDRSHNGSFDGFIYQIDMRPSMTVVGKGCAGNARTPLALAANGSPSIPNPSFTLALTGGPPGNSFFALGTRVLQPPLPLGRGCMLFVDPRPVVVVVPGTAQRTLPVPIPALSSLFDAELVWQGAVVETATGLLVTSNALVTRMGRYQ